MKTDVIRIRGSGGQGEHATRETASSGHHRDFHVGGSVLIGIMYFLIETPVYKYSRRKSKHIHKPLRYYY